MTVPARTGVRAVFVTWNPEPRRLLAAVESLSQQVDGVVIVDNGSVDYEALVALFALDDRVMVVGLGENLGIGAALNTGVGLTLHEDPAWIITMDQDTLVSAGAVAAILQDYSTLPPHRSAKCGVLALRPHPQPASILLTRYAESLMVLHEFDQFTERRGVITSGNLVRADLARQVHFNELMFIDQVDFDFCYASRRQGFVVLQQKNITMDHILGERFADVDKVHPYENAQRFYYVVRNSTYLVLRGRVLARYFVVQIVVIAGAFVSINGIRALSLGSRIIVRGIVDAILGRMGKREYAFLKRGRR